MTTPSVTSSIKHWISGLALGLIAGLAAPVAAQDLRLSVQEARALAQAAALQSEPRLARDVAAGLLRENRQDRVALIVLAAVEPQLGRPAQGRMAGARAWRLSNTRAERYEAARLTAFAAFREGRETLAQLWLRRAAANAPTGAALDQTGADFARIRQLNPWNIRLSFSAAPSSNVNGGSSSTLNVIDGLPFVGELSGDAQALSGWTASVDSQISYRIAATPQSRSSVSFRLYGRAVLLSDEAQEQAPDAENGDFSAYYAAVSFNHDRRTAGGTWGAKLTYGGNWYGGALANSFLRAGVDRTWRREDGTSLNLGLSLEDRRDDAGNWDATIAKVTGSTSQSLSLGVLSYGVALERTEAPSVNETSNAVRLSVGFALADPVGPATLSLRAGIDARHYPDYTFFVPVPGGREDSRAWATLEAAFEDWSYAGFAPVVSLTGSQTESNVSRYDRSEVSLGLSFRSTF